MKCIFLAERFGEQEYTVNGVRYIVASSLDNGNTLSSAVTKTNEISNLEN